MKKIRSLCIAAIICTLCLCGCSGVADKSETVETTDSTKIDVEVAEEEFEYLGRPGDKNSRAGDKISWKFDEDEGETVYIESHKRELTVSSDDDEMQLAVDNTRKKHDNFDGVFWDLEALYDQDAPICFYGGKNSAEEDFNDYVINMLKGTRFECKSRIETVANTTEDGKRSFTRSYTVPQTVLKKVIREAIYGDREAWFLLERFVKDSKTKASGLCEISVFGFSPKKNNVLFLSEMNGVVSAYTYNYGLFIREVPFAKILLEGHLRDVSDGNLSFISRHAKDSPELDFLDRLYEINLKSTQD